MGKSIDVGANLVKSRSIRRTAIRAGVAGVAAVGLVFGTTTAFADIVYVDGDTATPGGNASFSTSAGNCASTVDGAITLTYKSGDHHFVAGSPLTFAIDNVPGVNVTIDTANPTVPADWGTTTTSYTINFHTTITNTLVDGSYHLNIDTLDSARYDGGGKQVYNVSVGCGYPASTNNPPTDPGAPYLDSASVTPNNTGAFSVDWAGSTDPDTNDSVTYTLQKHDASTSAWTTVASGLTTNSYSFTGENEGTYTYQVQAADTHGASSNWATDSTPIVKVDKSAPNPPTASTDPTPAYNDGSSDWYKDGVTVTFSANGDPVLHDGSGGSGVASISTTSATYDHTNVAADGSFTVSSHATDNAGNVSSDMTVSGKVDWQAPVVTATCPTSAILNQPNVTASWSASDPAPSSGLATGSGGGTVTLDTSSVGAHTATIPAGVATDNVGHASAQATCTYTVGYNWNGFLQPINDTAHFVGETTSIFKAGSTVPVKFQLTDYYGNVVQAATSPVWLAPVRGNALVSAASVDETVYSTTATAGGVFRWDSTSQQYIYNWNTAKSQGGYYWRIGVVLDDGSTHTVSIGLK